jgi:hypothetical protein
VETSSAVSRSLREIVAGLKIPVYPNYDFDLESGRLDYVSPVLLNNKLVYYTNVLFELTELNLEYQEQLQIARSDRQRTQAQVDRTRYRVLDRAAVPSSYAKNLTLTEAFVRLQLVSQSSEAIVAYDGLVDEVTRTEARCAEWEALLQQVHGIAQQVEFACKNIQTHLSYVKKEQELGRHGL